MRELTDYSGDFIPDVRFQDFSKDALVRLLVAAAHDYIGVDGIWINTIRKRSDEIPCRWEVKLDE